MTRFFEVTHRDGAARLGRLLVRGGIETPCIQRPSDGLIVNAGSSLFSEQTSCAVDAFNVPPHVGLPYRAGKEFVQLFSPKLREDACKEAPAGAVVHPDWVVAGADMYIMAGARAIEGDSRSLLDSFIKIRASAKPDTALYVPAMATPENLSLLIYLGADVVDDVFITAKAYQGLYLTEDGEFKLDELAELPCTCEVCRNNNAEGLRSMPAAERYSLLARHNYLKLEEELKRVKLHVRRGMLREYVEKQCRSRPWLTGLLRLADTQYTYLEQRTPTYRSSEMLACSAESQNRVEVRRFAERVRDRFQAEGDILLIIPCSARKPYSTSQSHIALSRALGRLKGYVHEVILTSPMGVVPRELELVYPAAHYDVTVTGVWDLEERQWVSNCLRDFIDTHHFKKIIAHVEGPYVEVCQQTGRDMIFTSKGRIMWRTDNPIDLIENVVTKNQVLAMQDVVETRIFVDNQVLDYVSQIIRATREHPAVEVGVSPRGGLALLKLSRAYAAMCGRDFVTPDDVKAFVFEALGHRIIMGIEYEIEGNISSRSVIEEVVSQIEPPRDYARQGGFVRRQV